MSIKTCSFLLGLQSWEKSAPNFYSYELINFLETSQLNPEISRRLTLHQ
jgi:hypothetical protein